MKKKFVLILVSLLLYSFNLIAEDEDVLKGKKVTKYPFYIYKDAASKANHYIPSGWMGDYGDIKMKPLYKKKPKNGKTCLQVRYSSERKQGAGWAGIYWQNPSGNWGTQDGGYDLSKAKTLKFWARGEKGNEVIEVKFGGISGQYADSDSNTTGKIVLTKKWKQYKIDCKKLNLSYIIGGFCVVFTSDDNPDGATFYFDEIQYTK